MPRNYNIPRTLPDPKPVVGPAIFNTQRDPISLVPTRQVTRAAQRRADRLAGRPVQG